MDAIPFSDEDTNDNTENVEEVEGANNSNGDTNNSNEESNNSNEGANNSNGDTNNTSNEGDEEEEGNGGANNSDNAVGGVDDGIIGGSENNTKKIEITSTLEYEDLDLSDDLNELSPEFEDIDNSVGYSFENTYKKQKDDKLDTEIPIDNIKVININ